MSSQTLVKFHVQYFHPERFPLAASLYIVNIIQIYQFDQTDLMQHNPGRLL